MCPKRPSEEKENRHENWIVFAWPTEVVFLKIWWFWVVKRVDFECQSGAKLAFKLKTCKRLPALRFHKEFHRFLVSRGYVFGPNSIKKR